MGEIAEIRAALIQLAKALETERACVLRILKVIERQMEAEALVPVIIPVHIKGVKDENTYDNRL